jgi:hypothetical protein
MTQKQERKSYLKTLRVGVIPIQVLAANTITVEAPKILLKKVDFRVTFRGDFSIDEQFFLEHDGKTYSPQATSAEKITFKDIRINSLGQESYPLGSKDLKISE